MPIYNYKCHHCNFVDKDVFVHSVDSLVTCGKCHLVTTRQFSVNFNAKVFPPDGIFLEHVSAKGKRFHSKKEMIVYAREHNLELGALL